MERLTGGQMDRWTAKPTDKCKMGICIDRKMYRQIDK